MIEQRHPEGNNKIRFYVEMTDAGLSA